MRRDPFASPCEALCRRSLPWRSRTSGRRARRTRLQRGDLVLFNVELMHERIYIGNGATPARAIWRTASVTAVNDTPAERPANRAAIVDVASKKDGTAS